MARFIPKIVEPILNYVPSPEIENIVAYASKAIRAKIILDRNIRGFEKAERNGGPFGYEYESSKPATRKQEKDSQTQIKNKRGGKEIDSEGYVAEETRLSRVKDEIKSYIAIVDLDFKPEEHNDKRHYSYLQLPFVPRELSYNPESSFVGIASFGKNNPFYQFTGSEDTLTFEIDWHSKRNDRRDVIFNCRWIEALTKGDAYDETPHRVKLVWGNEDRLFDSAVWLVTAAPYTLTQFVKGYRDAQGSVVSVGMLPQQANQQITLKRLTTYNLSSREIITNPAVDRVL